MFLIGLILVGVAEVAAFVAVGDRIGFLWATVLLLGVSVLGPFIVRRVGFGVLVHTQQRLERGEVPTREVLDGIVILIAGAMICVPGFIGDAIGLLLMIGPVRHFVIGAFGRRLARRVQVMRTDRWPVIDARSRAAGDYPPPPPHGPLGPGR